MDFRNMTVKHSSSTRAGAMNCRRGTNIFGGKAPRGFVSLLAGFILFAALAGLPAKAFTQDYVLTVAVLVNSSNTAGYNKSATTPGEYQKYPERYLEHLQVPYQVFDVATQSPPADLAKRQLILIGHSGVNLSTAWQTAVINAVGAGTGLVNLDWSTTIGNTNYIRTIFGATGSYAGTAGTSITVPADVASGGSNEHYIAAMQKKFAIDPPGDFTYNFHVDKNGAQQTATATVLTGATGTTIARIGSNPLILATYYNLGKAVHFGTLQYLKADRFGFLMGVDDLFWRSLVWSARKPFVVRGYPRYMAIQMDDTKPGWGFRVQDLYNPAYTGNLNPDGTGGPWKVTGFLYTDNIVPGSAERTAVISDIQQQKLRVCPHTFNNNVEFGNLYWNGYLGDLTDDEWLANLDALELWRVGLGGSDTIPDYSKHWVAHYWDITDNTGYDAWETLGFRYITSIQKPGYQNYLDVTINNGAERINGRPFRLYEQPPKTVRDENYSIFFADDYTINSRSGLPSKTFFLFTSQYIDWDQFPRPDLAWPSDKWGMSPTESVEQLKKYAWRFWSSLAPVQMYTHDDTNYELASASGREYVIANGSQWLGQNGAIHTFIDDLAAYVRARNKSVLTDVRLTGGQLSYTFTGDSVTGDNTPVQTELRVFQNDTSEGILTPVQGFTGGTTVTMPVPPPPPTIFSITPSNGSYLGGTTVTISGDNLINVISVSVGSNLAGNLVVNSPSSVTVTTPPGGTGPADVVVITETGVATLLDGFNYFGPPVISSIEPDYGIPQGGTLITINGEGFIPSSSVRIGGSPATSVTYVDSTRLTVITPAGSLGSADVQVGNSYGVTGFVGGFLYSNLLFWDDFNDGNANGWTPSPLGYAGGWSVIDGVYTYNGAGHTQSYQGNGLWGDYTLSVDFRLSSMNNNPGGIRGRINPATGAGYAVWVYPANGVIQLWRTTGWNIDTVGLTQLGAAGGIAFDTANFHKLALELNGDSIKVYYDGQLIITAIDSTYKNGLIALDVSNQAISFDNVAVQLAESNDALTINTISPSVGSLAGGNTVQISGSGFSVGTVVNIGGAPATNVVIQNSSYLTAITPAGTLGPADVTVQNAKGTAVLSGAFTYALFYDDFNTGSANAWTISPLGLAAGWSVVNGAYTYNGGGHTQSYAGDASWTDYSLYVDFKLYSMQNTPGGIRGRVDPTTGTSYAVWLYPAQGVIRLWRAAAWNIDTQGLTQLGSAGGISFDTTQFHRLQMKLSGSTIEVYYDGALVISAVDGTYGNGLVALDVSNQQIQFDNVRVVGGFSQPVIGLNSSPLSFSAMQGSSNPAAQSLMIGNSGGGTLSWTAQGSASWLTASPNNGTAPSALNVAVDITGLSAGTYTGKLSVSANGASNSPQDISVTLTVSAPVPPTVTAIDASSGPQFGGVPVTITGTGFITGTTITFNGQSATNVVINSATSITALTPAGIAGPADVAAHTSYGTGTLTAGYTYMNLLFYDDFNTNTANQWGISPLGHAAGWSVVKGTYNFDGSGHTQSYAGEAYWSDYLLGVDFQLFGIANNPGGIRGRVNPDTGAGYAVWIYPENGRIVLWRTTDWNIDNAGLTQLGAATGITFDAGRSHRLQARFNGTDIEVYYDGTLVISAADATYTSGLIALDVSNQPVRFDNVTVTPPATIGVNPGSLSFSAVQGMSNPSSQGITISNSGGETLAWAAQSTASWLTISPAGGTAPAAATASVNISGLTAGTYNGTILVSGTRATNSPQSIPVTLTVAPPPVISLSPTSLSFAAVQGSSNPATQSISISNTGGGTLAWTASDSASWLSLSPASGTAPSTLTASVNISGLSAGTYNGTITVNGTGASNSPQTLPVTLTVAPPPAISLSPTSLSFAAVQGGSNPATQNVSISNTGGGTLNWTASDNASWLSLSPTSGTAPSTLTASVNISGLSAGTYNGTITVSATGASNSPRTVSVTLTVAPPPAIGLSPTSLSFSAVQGGSNPATQNVAVSNTGGGTLNWTASDNASWLSLSPTSGTAPSTLTASVNISGLSAGTYNGTITVSATGASNSPRSISVTLTVSPPPAIGLSPTSLSFTAVQGSSNPSSQNVSITNTGGGTLAWSASEDASWLSLSPSSGTAPSTLAASVNISGLAVGTYTGTITVSASGATNSPRTIPVTLTITTAPTIGLSPTSLSFSATRYGSNPSSKTVSITNTGGGTLSWSASENASWLSLSPSSGTAPSTLTVSVNKSGLSTGTYNATITVTGTGATNSPRTIPVTLTITN